MTPPPSEQDRDNAAQIVDHIERLRALGDFAEQDVWDGAIHFAACVLRNARMLQAEAPCPVCAARRERAIAALRPPAGAST
jgi:hypothetical protein